MRTREPALLCGANGRAIGNAAGELIATADEGALRRGVERALHEGRAHVAEIAGATLSFVPLFGDPGGPSTVLVIARPLEELTAIFHELYGVDQHFASLVHLVPQAVFTARPSGTIDFISRRFETITGGRMRRYEGSERFFDAVAAPERASARRAWDAGIASGRAFEFSLRINGARGVRWHHLEATPWHESGRLIKWIATLADIDDRVTAREDLERAQGRLRLLSDLSAATAEASTVGELLDAASRLLSAWMGGHCLIELTARGERVAASAAPPDGRLLLERISRERNGSGGREAIAALPNVRVRSVGGAELGGFVAFHDARFFLQADDDDVLSEALGRIVSAAERVLKARRERAIGETLQRAMLPLVLPQVAGLRFDASYRAADADTLVGGDWYDAFTLADGRVALSIGDVAGHGLDAAVTMSRVRGAIRANAVADADPATVLQNASAIVTLENAELVTAFFGVLDPLTLAFSYANAGHPPPLVVEAQNVRFLRCDGPPLGIDIEGAVGRVTHHADTAAMHALVLYTDGLVEIDRDYLAGERRLTDLVAVWSAAGFSRGAADLQASLAGGRPSADDAALFVVRVARLDEIDVVLPATRAAVERAALAAGRFADDAGCLPEARTRLVAALTEALVNAADHAYRASREGTMRLEVRRDGTAIVVRVSDRGAWWPAVVQHRSGGGISRMRGLATTFAIAHDASGTVVEMRFARSLDAAAATR